MFYKHLLFKKIKILRGYGTKDRELNLYVYTIQIHSTDIIHI